MRVAETKTRAKPSLMPRADFIGCKSIKGRHRGIRGVKGAEARGGRARDPGLLLTRGPLGGWEPHAAPEAGSLAGVAVPGLLQPSAGQAGC